VSLTFWQASATACLYLGCVSPVQLDRGASVWARHFLSPKVARVQQQRAARLCACALAGACYTKRMSAITSPVSSNDTHGLPLGYLLWLFGFTGAHRFYYGRPITGTLWFFTLGLLGVGWLIDLFLIPGMEAKADRRYREGPYSYGVAWLLLTFLGLFGIHRFYIGKWFTGAIWLLTGGVFAMGYLYDYWTLNEQVSERNS
jgi:TM2 domain-containing membrane protein YozV